MNYVIKSIQDYKKSTDNDRSQNLSKTSKGTKRDNKITEIEGIQIKFLSFNNKISAIVNYCKYTITSKIHSEKAAIMIKDLSKLQTRVWR